MKLDFLKKIALFFHGFPNSTGLVNPPPPYPCPLRIVNWLLKNFSLHPFALPFSSVQNRTVQIFRCEHFIQGFQLPYAQLQNHPIFDT